MDEVDEMEDYTDRPQDAERVECDTCGEEMLEDEVVNGPAGEMLCVECDEAEEAEALAEANAEWRMTDGR